MSSIKLAESLEQLENTPYSYEQFRREYLWKHYLYGALGPRACDDINIALKEIDLVGCKHNIGVGSALEIVMSPTYQPQLILHKYPDVVLESIEYLLNGTNEHIINPSKLKEAHEIAIRELRIALNNTYYKQL